MSEQETALDSAEIAELRAWRARQVRYVDPEEFDAALADPEQWAGLRAEIADAREHAASTARPTVGRVVWFRHAAVKGLVLPALIVATPESYAALSDKALVVAGDWNFPGFTTDADETDQQRVHLVVFTPSNKEPSREIDRGGRLDGPCFVQANCPFDQNPVPGTWGWPE